MASKSSFFLRFLFLVVLAPAYAHSDVTRINLGDRVIAALIDHPKSAGPHPVLLMVAGAEGSTRDAFYERIASAAVQEGFVSVRLDWTYKQKGGAPSTGLLNEAEELRLMLTEVLPSRMMKQYEIDATQVAVFAKILGAKIAMIPEAGGVAGRAKALLLYNPACESEPGSFAKIYAPFNTAKTPRMIIATRESGACPPSQIYGAAKDFDENTSLYILEKDSAKEEAGIAASLTWLKNLGWKSSMPVKKKPEPRRR